jgi:hypothetical protein
MLVDSAAVPKPLPAVPLIVLCPHCKLDGLKAVHIEPDLRTIAVRCSECGRVSVIAISE